MALDWSPDMRSVAYLSSIQPRIYLYDVSTKKSSLLLQGREGLAYDEMRFSPQGKQVVFVEQAGPDKREIIIAPFLGGTIADRHTWIRLDTGSQWNNDPRWTPDGRSLVFVSRRDSFKCIWRIRLDDASRAVSLPEPVEHLHAAAHSLEELSDLSFQLTVGGDEVFYNVAELSGTIWAARPQD